MPERLLLGVAVFEAEDVPVWLPLEVSVRDELAVPLCDDDAVLVLLELDVSVRLALGVSV